MVQHIVTPIDGSTASWRAAGAAATLARLTNSSLTYLTVEFDPADRAPALDHLRQGVDPTQTGDLHLDLEVRITTSSVAEQIEAVVEERPGTIVVMSSHGRGRSAAIVGSVADDVLRRTFGPLVLLGPHVTSSEFSGPVLIAVDDVGDAELAVPLGVAWAIELSLEPWIVHAAPSATLLPTDTFETGWLASLAHRFEEVSGHEIEFDAVHGRHPAADVAAYAERHEAALVVGTTHARTGLQRLAHGSVMAGLVRQATCPVLVARDLPAHAA